MSKVIKAIHETVVNGKMPSKAIASAIGKPYTTLMRETNPYDPGAKLGVETFMAIIQATGDVGPLELMVQELGYVLQSRKQPCMAGAAWATHAEKQRKLTL